MISKYTFQKMQIFEKIDQSSPTLPRNADSGMGGYNQP